ncbi:hypothetical protein KKF38_04675 [Patescibacteria group bacterium]|nr:hypothetical protein [Patescibacteria group bacterium]
MRTSEIKIPDQFKGKERAQIQFLLWSGAGCYFDDVAEGVSDEGLKWLKTNFTAARLNVIETLLAERAKK